MERRLKKQRNRLFLRVTLILLTVWIAVSATYCVIRLNSEKAELQSGTFSDLSYAKQMITLSENGTLQSATMMLDDFNLVYFRDLMKDSTQLQIRVIDSSTGTEIADTSGKENVIFSLQTEIGSYPDCYGYIDYSTIREKLTDAQYQRIIELLNKVSEDGRSYELVCTGFCIIQSEFIPTELSVVLTESSDSRFDRCEIVEVFGLGGTEVYRNSAYRMNIIPKAFFLSEGYGGDLIGLLSDDERRENVKAISLGRGEYLFYSSEYYYLDAVLYNDATNQTISSPDIYLLQYARRVNLFDKCLGAMMCGIASLFGFIFVIGVLICVMIWNTVRMQMIEEQKRIDLTNALAHDIKTPLFVISGYAYSLKENIDSDDRDSYLDKIILQTEQINSQVHKMLNLSKLSSYSMTLNRSEFDLSELVKEILDEYINLPDGRSFAFFHTGESTVSADRELLCSALQNLIENAVKYSPGGSKIIIEVTGKRIIISNPSQPVSKAELKKIWQPYYRVDKSRHKKGNGLGLSIVKSILDLHSAKYDMTMKDGCMVFQAEF